MVKYLYPDYPEVSSPVAMIIISISLMLFLGFLMTRLTKKLRLPNVTAYILTGILIGPFCLNMIPDRVVAGMDFLPDIALAFIAFSTGEFFKLSTLKKNGLKVVVITILEALTASVLVFILTYFILGLNLPFSIVLAALASATAPASTVMTIRQTKAKGDFVETLLQVVALDDIVGLVAYSIAISVAVSSISGKAFSAMSIIKPILINIGIMALGGLFGFFLKALIFQKRSKDNRLIISIALIFAFCGVCAMLGVSPLLGCMSMSTVYVNLTDDDKLFKQLNYFSPPLLLLFFVRSGVSFDLDSLVHASGAVGATPLLVIGVLYFVVRIVGKYVGAFVGCALAGKNKKVRDYLGLALIPQAGVAIGLAALGARTLGGETGNALQTIILASSVLYELIGPACGKLSLYLSGSYSKKIEDIVEVKETDENGVPKTSLELLIERIQAIQEEIPEHAVSEEELAFTAAAEEYDMMSPIRTPNRRGLRHRF
ncbi:MAG: cation:proton antiporter [Lachnospiraceae bacterium]|jgi:Kef-type K+ transport system membrane component KefB|nr:cation:proton antiporter [Lachnospiraceae bacterium]